MPPSFSGLYFRGAQRSHSSLHETKVEYIFLCSGFAFVFWINDIRTLDSQIFMISMCIWLYYFCKYKQLRLLLCKIHWIYLFIHVSACVIFTGTTFEPYSWKYAKNFIVKLASVRYSRLGAQTANDCRSRYVANTHISESHSPISFRPCDYICRRLRPGKTRLHKASHIGLCPWRKAHWHHIMQKYAFTITIFFKTSTMPRQRSIEIHLSANCVSNKNITASPDEIDLIR